MIEKSYPIWLGNAVDNQYIEAQESFTLDKSDGVCLSIYADTEYAVYINKKFAGTGQYHSYDKDMVYDKYDIAHLLCKGENVINIIAYHQGTDSSTYRRREASLAFAVYDEDNVYAVSDTATKLRQHPHYKSGEIEWVSTQLGYTYHYDASAIETPWENAVVKTTDAKFTPRPVKKLVHKPLCQGRIKTQGVLRRRSSGTPAHMMQTDFLSYRDNKEIFDGKTIKHQPEGAYFVIDLGDELAGLLEFSITAVEGTILDIGYGEHLEDMRVRTKIADRSFACRYICTSGKQYFCGYFRRFACRYISVHITNMQSDVEIHSFGLIPTEYPLSKVSNFVCEDYLFNRIYDTAVKTVRLCMHEHYEDCPWREQALYAFDSYIQSLCSYYAFGEYDFAKESLRLLAQGQRSDGFLELCAPAKSPITIPSFSLIWIMSLEKYVLYSGDIDFGREMLPAARRILDSYEIKDGIVDIPKGDEYWDFYEWTEGLISSDGTTAPTPANAETTSLASCYYILACESYNKIASWTGTGMYPVDIEQLRRRVYEYFSDTGTGLIKSRKGDSRYHEMTQALALCSGVTRDKKIADLLVKKDSGLIKNSLSTSIFKYEALLSYGGEYIDAVTDEIADIWGSMLFSGADTFWETAQGADDFGRAGSLCHGWSAVPVYLLYKYYLGYEPLSPGFKVYKSEPVKAKNIGLIKADLYMPDLLIKRQQNVGIK